MKGIVVILLVGMMFFGCVKPPSYSVVPSITFNSMSPTTVSSSVLQISNPPDTTRVMINFTDGDGDIGLTQNDTTYDAYFIDTRPAGGGKFKVITIDSFAIPYVNPSGNIKAISGTINFTINSITGRAGEIGDNGVHDNWDTLYYSVYIRDRAGHQSNTIQTPYLYIKDK